MSHVIACDTQRRRESKWSPIRPVTARRDPKPRTVPQKASQKTCATQPNAVTNRQWDSPHGTSDGSG